MAKAFVIGKKDLSFGIYVNIDDLFNEINNKKIKPSDFYFFTNEKKALDFQEQLINRKRIK
jgi:hypothetical protein